MSLSGPAWDQVRSISVDDLIRALKRDDWFLDMNGGSMQIFKKGERRVSVHYHAGKTFGPKLLKQLLEDIGWSEANLRTLKLIK